MADKTIDELIRELDSLPTAPGPTPPDVNAMIAELGGAPQQQPKQGPQVITYTDESGRKVSEEIFLNPHTGQMTSRQMLADQPASLAESMGRGYMQGYGWNAADEMMGGISGALPGAGTPTERARFGREMTRARQEAAWRDKPLATLAGTMAGGVGSAVGLGALGGKAMNALGLSVKPAATGLGVAGRMAAGGGLGGAVEGFASGEGARDRVVQMGLGGIAGAALAPLAGYGAAKVADTAGRIGGKALNRVFTSREMFNPSTGEITDTGRESLRALGYNVDDLTKRMQAEMARAANAATDGKIPAGAVPGVAAAQRFDVPLTKGQATGDIMQIATEQNMRARSRTQSAFDTMAQFDARQDAAVNAARQGIIPGQEGGAIDAADTVIDAVRARAEEARLAGRAAYDALEQSGAAVKPEAFPALRRTLEFSAASDGFPISERTPNAESAVAFLERTFQTPNGGAVPFMNIERARQGLNQFRQAAKRGSAAADAGAMNAVIRNFDDWLNDAVTSALASGDETVLAQAKNARGLWSQYARTFMGRDGADRFIRKIVDDDLAPDEVARWMFGSTSIVGGGRTSLVAARIKDILGDASPEWASVRRAAWDQTTIGPGGDMFGPDKIVSNLNNLLGGKGQTLSRVLFTPDELRQIAEFRTMMKALQVPKLAANPSGTSYDIQRAAQSIGKMLIGNVGTAAMGPAGGVGAVVAANTGGKWSSALAARAAVRGLDMPTVSPAVGAGATVSGMSAGQSLINNQLNRGPQR